MDWKTFAWIKRGNRRKEALKILSNSNQPLSPTDMKNKMKISLPQISLLLRELAEQEVITCLNAEDPIGKLYVANKKGKMIMKELEK